MKRLILLVIFFVPPFLTLAMATKGVCTDPPPRQPSPEPKGDFVNQPYWGCVTELSKNTITIQFNAQKDQKPRRFLVSDTLAAGKVPMEPRAMPDSDRKYFVQPIKMYRLTDVKVGDWVCISYARVAGTDICDHICIQKRPGGRIPPLPEEAEALRRPREFPGLPKRLFIPYHEYWNAYWDLEEKGIPFPEKFGPNRRWPVAPMPREVKPHTTP